MKLNIAVISSLIITATLTPFHAYADAESCANFSRPLAPIPPMPAMPKVPGFESTPSPPEPEPDGFFAPKKITKFDAKLFGVELGKPYPVSEIDGLAKSVSENYGLTGRISSGLGKGGFIYRPFDMFIGPAMFFGYVDPQQETVLFYQVSVEMTGIQDDWNALNAAMQAKFGEGFTANGVQNENYAAQYKDGIGGWSADIYKQCSKSIDCATTAKIKYRNRFINNSTGGVCMTDYYKLSVTKNDTLNEYKKAESDAKNAAIQKEADTIQLTKPKI